MAEPSARPDQPAAGLHDQLPAYRAGTLSLAEFERVDAWLASLPAAEQELLLTSTDDRVPAFAAPGVLFPAGAAFRSEAPHGRFEPRGPLGRGGMGLVELVYDRVLEREVALKRCRPRAPEESPDSHALRLRLFRREATVTARLEHPGIVPLHDVGIAAAGEPAYVMKRLQGTTLAARIPLPPAEAAVLLLRVADAVAFAHHQGVVHRDLKPEHVWLGADGEVLLLDWGLAGMRGSTLAADGALGTPPWRAPEQTAAAPADPRMDVWGLGGLILATLTGQGPDSGVPPARGLGAIAFRCLHQDPAQRYADGAAVAADIRHWLRVGLAAAEKPTTSQRLVAWLRRHPVAGLLLATGVASLGYVVWERQLATRSAQTFLEAPLPGPEALQRWQAELAELPATAAVQRARERIRRSEQIRSVQEASTRYRRTGPWPEEIADLEQTLHLAGIDPLTANAASHLRQHPIREALLPVLAQLQRALVANRSATPLTTAIPQLIQAAAPDDAWRSLGDLLSRPIIRNHDLELCPCPESEAALLQPDTAEVLLALYAPDARLEQLALKRLAIEPGSFWARIVAGRAALQNGQMAAARTHALVALGADPLSLWPHLLLAYVALADHDQVALESATAAGLRSNPAHLELLVLRAVRMARGGELAAAQALIAGLDEAPHLQHHLQQRSGHPMERAVDALVAAGVQIAAAAPAAGPVVHPR